MKIALITPDVHGYAGVSRYVAALASALADEHEVTIFSNTYEGLEHSRIRHRKVWALGRNGPVRSITFALASSLLLVLSNLRGASKFDIIHSQGDYVANADVVTSHFCEAAEAERLRGDRKSGSFGYRLRHRAMALLERMVVNRTQRKPLIVPSERMQRDFTRLHAVPKERIFVIQGGVDSGLFSSRNARLTRQEILRRHSLTGRDSLVLLVGADGVRKGISETIEAFSRLKTQTAKLIVVGPEDIGLYRSLARTHGVEEKIIFAGRSREIWKYYKASDVFILPSLYEAFGLATLEAMATGLPVLVSHHAGSAELVRDGYNGLLIDEPGNILEISSKLDTLLADEGLRGQLGHHARLTALEHSWDNVAQKHLEVYGSRIDQRNV